MAVDLLSPEFRKRQSDALQHALMSGCTKKEMINVIYPGTSRKAFRNWLKRCKLEHLVTEDQFQTYTPKEVSEIVTAFGDPTKQKSKFYESLK